MAADQRYVIDAEGVYYKQLNEQIRAAVRAGHKSIELLNVRGQRYIANSLEGEDIDILVHGVPGQDMAAFMRGPRLTVEGNAQDGVGNTMDAGEIVINGMVGDVLGYAMRGGRVFVKGDAGYRCGIHMKAYMDKFPVLVIGGKAGDFLGEYMAGGAIILLGMFSDKPAEVPITGRSLGTGMHGGVIYIRGNVPDYQLGKGLAAKELDADERAFLEMQIRDYATALGLDAEAILDAPFQRVKPYTHRPYGNMYVGTN
ncbi:GltB/FmdC/FwdC-like GXGXG domain-containing protein [Megalodesulfovibrio paquesii]